MVHNYLFQPEIVLARELIKSGALGQVEMVIVNFLGIHDFPGTQRTARRGATTWPDPVGVS